MSKRKILEIYTEENENETTFIIEKVEDSKVANETIKALATIFYNLKDKDDKLKINYEED